MHTPVSLVLKEKGNYDLVIKWGSNSCPFETITQGHKTNEEKELENITMIHCIQLSALNLV